MYFKSFQDFLNCYDFEFTDEKGFNHSCSAVYDYFYNQRFKYNEQWATGNRKSSYDGYENAQEYSNSWQGGI